MEPAEEEDRTSQMPDHRRAGIVSGICRKERAAVIEAVLAGELAPSEAAAVPVMRRFRMVSFLERLPHPEGYDFCRLLSSVGVVEPDRATVRRLGARQADVVLAVADSWLTDYIEARDAIYARIARGEASIADVAGDPAIMAARASAFMHDACHMTARQVSMAMNALGITRARRDVVLVGELVYAPSPLPEMFIGRLEAARESYLESRGRLRELPVPSASAKEAMTC
ncbi:MAG: hypothetical protein Q4B30_06745 [Coriobacteriaceae bacterium]|nr:hypothetical protein [Coriobacteriaceae bacterium]